MLPCHLHNYHESCFAMIKAFIACCLAALVSAAGVPVMAAEPDWEAEVRKFDASYWDAFNNCEVDKLTGMNTKDLEFYHDKGGATFGLVTFAADIKNNICSNAKPRVRREAVADSVRVFPMRDEGKMYGALISGEHRFFRTVAGKAEVEGGTARFTHLLTLTDGVWKVARVLSFDHGPSKVKNVFSRDADGQRRVKVQEGGKTVEEATAPAIK